VRVIETASLEVFNKSLDWVSGPAESDRAIEVCELAELRLVKTGY
jgi:hypothetical protein